MVPPEPSISLRKEPSDDEKISAGESPRVKRTGVTVASSVADGSFDTTIVPWSVKSSHPLGTAMWNPS
jgi:hypothetical protein